MHQGPRGGLLCRTQVGPFADSRFVRLDTHLDCKSRRVSGPLLLCNPIHRNAKSARLGPLLQHTLRVAISLGIVEHRLPIPDDKVASGL